MHGSDGECTAKKLILRFVPGNCEKSPVKHPIENPILLNFVNLSTIFCPRLQKLYFMAFRISFNNIIGDFQILRPEKVLKLYENFVRYMVPNRATHRTKSSISH